MQQREERFWFELAIDVLGIVPAPRRHWTSGEHHGLGRGRLNLCGCFMVVAESWFTKWKKQQLYVCTCVRLRVCIQALAYVGAHKAVREAHL